MGSIGFLNGRFWSRVTDLVRARQEFSGVFMVLKAGRRDSDWDLLGSDLERVETNERIDEALEDIGV